MGLFRLIDKRKYSTEAIVLEQKPNVLDISAKGLLWTCWFEIRNFSTRNSDYVNRYHV